LFETLELVADGVTFVVSRLRFSVTFETCVRENTSELLASEGRVRSARRTRNRFSVVWNRDGDDFATKGNLTTRLPPRGVSDLRHSGTQNYACGHLEDITGQLKTLLPPDLLELRDNHTSIHLGRQQKPRSERKEQRTNTGFVTQVFRLRKRTTQGVAYINVPGCELTRIVTALVHWSRKCILPLESTP
jgi:hypothetical protein